LEAVHWEGGQAGVAGQVGTDGGPEPPSQLPVFEYEPVASPPP